MAQVEIDPRLKELKVESLRRALAALDKAIKDGTLVRQDNSTAISRSIREIK